MLKFDNEIMLPERLLELLSKENNFYNFGFAIRIFLADLYLENFLLVPRDLSVFKYFSVYFSESFSWLRLLLLSSGASSKLFSFYLLISDNILLVYTYGPVISNYFLLPKLRFNVNGELICLSHVS